MLSCNLKAKLLPKCNLGFFLWMFIPSYKSIITTKEALLRFAVFLFSGQTHFQWECKGHFYDSIKISIFKTQRRLDTTWNFARSITRVSTHEHKHWEHCLCTQSLLKNKVLEQLKLAVACSARRRPASGEVLISECDATWRTVKVDSYCLPTRYLTWLFRPFILVLFLIRGSFFNFKQQIIRAFIWN